MQQQDVFQHVFNRPVDDPGNKSFLQKVTEKYPYFGIAHFYLLKNTAFHETDFNTIAAKTNLFFKSTQYVQSLLQSSPIEEVAALTITKAESTQAKEVVIEFLQHDEKVMAKSTDMTVEEGAANEMIDAEMLQPKVVADEIVVEKMEALKKTMVQQDDKMLFEPLHASDYFASQGIKLSEAQLADDKLGKQLKSFTSWLKTMKKVHPDKLPVTNVIVEKAIQTQAEKSNIEEDIYTEAMAEAYLLQGKENKAVEIYTKLSLMIPSKSTYFATKIDSLK